MQTHTANEKSYEMWVLFGLFGSDVGKSEIQELVDSCKFSADFHAILQFYCDVFANEACKEAIKQLRTQNY